MKTRPRWIKKDLTDQIAMVVRNPSNPNDWEVFMIKIDTDEKSSDKIIFNGCVAATRRIVELMDRGNYFKNTIFNYSEKVSNEEKGSITTVTLGVGISIPSQRRAKQLDNRYELFAEILAMNGINFSRPAMGGVDL